MAGELRAGSPAGGDRRGEPSVRGRVPDHAVLSDGANPAAAGFLWRIVNADNSY
ncbi:hypothetical protein EMIT0158MI4_90180 [Burkholderia ambifaria]